MVQEMKFSFTSAMEELAKTQYGDESLQQQLSNDRENNLQQITELTDLVKSLKVSYNSSFTSLKVRWSLVSRSLLCVISLH
jgi:hypothetical protein